VYLNFIFDLVMLRREALAIMDNRIKGKQFYFFFIFKNFIFKFQ